MKIVNFSGGLGNQIFQYIFVEYLRNKYVGQRIYGYYNAQRLKMHNGLEIDRVFDVVLPPHTWWTDKVAGLCRILNRIGVKAIKSTDYAYSEDAIYYDGWWQDKKFFQNNIISLTFRHFEIDDINGGLLEQIHNCQSVFIHIRRGDYYTPEHISTYGGICTKEYYNTSIGIIKRKIENPHFFVFSNDFEWVKCNLDLPNSTYVENNKGKNSFWDMYLMSQCKGGILANSTFSYWGAMLNKNKPVVVYPEKWFNTQTPDMFPINWIAI